MALSDIFVITRYYVLCNWLLIIWFGWSLRPASSSSTQAPEWVSQSRSTYFQNESLGRISRNTSLSNTHLYVSTENTNRSFLGPISSPTTTATAERNGGLSTIGSEVNTTSSAPKNMTAGKIVSDKKTSVFFIDINECSDHKVFQLLGVGGEIWGIAGGENRSRTTTECHWTIRVPGGYLASSSVTFILSPCLSSINIVAVNNLKGCEQQSFLCRSRRGSILAVSSSNQQVFHYSDSLTEASRVFQFRIQVQAVPVTDNIYNSLPLSLTSPTSGSVTSYRFDEGIQLPCGTNATRQIISPDGHVMMISFPVVYLGKTIYTVLKLYDVNKQGTLRLIAILYEVIKGPTFLVTNIFLHVQAKSIRLDCGFKMLFSFHLVSEAPQKLDSGLWDCSVPHYDTFKQHLECNLEPECQRGEDEGPHCPFSSPACNGSVAVGNKCYQYVENKVDLTWRSSEEECRKRGGTVASMKSREEWETFLKLFQYGKRRNIAFVGLRTSDTDWPRYYKYALVWADGCVSYETNTTQEYFEGLSRSVCGFYEYVRPLRSVLMECDTPNVKNVICEYRVQLELSTSQNEILFPTILDPMMLWSERDKVSVIQCPGGHVTHLFSSCDPKSFCGKTGLPTSCRTTTGLNVFTVTQMFVCDDHFASLPYSLVCDFRPDCLDASDEKFCKHDRKCQEFTCRSGQCISKNKYCDLYKDCWDGSDEGCMSDYFYEYPPKYRLFPPAIVYFDGQGEFYQVPLAPSQPCPQTHFRCAGESAYCLPVYVRCNGVYDCPSHEDEEDCQHYTCPGFYRCRASSVCVHADNVCDGWPQCPQHDDEMFCGLRCPKTCVCQGLAFVCREPFPTKDHPNIRYLDGTGSGMTLYDVASNTYLVWLSLASCGLTKVYYSELPNLQVLDLSDNEIAAVDLSDFRSLKNLKLLRLAGNPLVSLINTRFNIYQVNLQAVDVSRCLLTEFESRIFLEFPFINNLNISSNKLEEVTENRFTYLPKLAQLDIRGNPLEVFPIEILKTVKYLDTVFADNYKICCKQNLPDLFDKGSCFAPEDEISSCDDLLRSDIYRIFLWLFCAMSISGNVGSFLFRQFYGKSQSVSGFGIFVTNLSVSDFLMGVYLATIGAADQIYRSTYLWHDVQWKVSITCKVAGFLSFLSSEVSALIICLITLDRFIVLRFPFSNFRFDGRSASWVCGLAWVVGLALAGVPLLPFFSHWEFYSQNGICIPLPITRKNFSGRSYSFGVMIIFNVVLFAFIAFGQICIYWSVRMNSMQANTTKKSKDIVIARRLATVVVSDFLCWFPIGLVSIMAASGIPVPGEVSVIMIIFVLPLNASLNPFLYTFNLLLEKWREMQETRMLKRWRGRVSSPVCKSLSSDVSDRDTSGSVVY